MSNSSIGLIDKARSGTTIPGLSGPGSDSNKGVLRIPGASPSNGLVLYPGHSLWGRGILCCDDSVIGRYSFKRGVRLTVQSATYPLIVYEYIIWLYFSIIWVNFDP